MLQLCSPAVLVASLNLSASQVLFLIFKAYMALLFEGPFQLHLPIHQIRHERYAMGSISKKALARPTVGGMFSRLWLLCSGFWNSTA